MPVVREMYSRCKDQAVKVIDTSLARSVQLVASTHPCHRLSIHATDRVVGGNVWLGFVDGVCLILSAGWRRNT